MKPLRFCASCGSSLLQGDHEGGARCSACGRVWYRNPAPTVGAAIVSDDRALVTERAREPAKGLFDVPGGFLAVGEQPLDGLRREVREELGVDIDVSEGDFVQAVSHRYGAEGEWLVSLGFRARLAGGEPVARDDVAAVRWIGRDELDALAWAWAHDLELVKRALEEEAGDG